MTVLSRRSLLLFAGAAAVGVAGYAGVVWRSAPSENAATMTPKEAFAAAASGEVLLVDIRRPDEWETTGLPEHAVPLDMRDDGFLTRVREARVSESQPVALICARGVRSARLTHRLDAAGIGPIIDVPEGMLGSRAGPGWLERGLPVALVN